MKEKSEPHLDCFDCSLYIITRIGSFVSSLIRMMAVFDNAVNYFPFHSQENALFSKQEFLPQSSK